MEHPLPRILYGILFSAKRKASHGHRTWDVKRNRRLPSPSAVCVDRTHYKGKRCWGRGLPKKAFTALGLSPENVRCFFSHLTHTRKWYLGGFWGNSHRRSRERRFLYEAHLCTQPCFHPCVSWRVSRGPCKTCAQVEEGPSEFGFPSRAGNQQFQNSNSDGALVRVFTVMPF